MIIHRTMHEACAILVWLRQQTGRVPLACRWAGMAVEDVVKSEKEAA